MRRGPGGAGGRARQRGGGGAPVCREARLGEARLRRGGRLAPRPGGGPPAGSPLGVAQFVLASWEARASRDGAEWRPLEASVRSVGVSAPPSAAGCGRTRRACFGAPRARHPQTGVLGSYGAWDLLTETSWTKPLPL